MRGFLVAAMLLCMALSVRILSAQTSNGSVSGLVHDKANAVIPGVMITLTGADTGVASTVLTNETGAYTFASVPPGNYKLSAELAGFKGSSLTGVNVGTSAQVRLDFTLEVGGTSTSVEVSVSSQQLLSESSASIGQVLPADRVTALPLVSGEVLDLVRIMPGMRVDPFGDAFSTFTGLQTSTINTVRDGLSVTDTRNANGISGTTTLNPDLVGEIRIILTPVDAELGRGNGQVQISTRSGTNKYTGAAVWNVRNSAFSANSWTNNRNVDSLTGQWKPIPLNWQNDHQYTISYGGPIIKNKTFFFALWDQNINNNRTLVTTNVLTDAARQGILRYWSGWNPGNAQQPVPNFPASATSGIYPSVDATGKPVAPLSNPNGTPYTGGLQCFSVFGSTKFDGSPFTAADCPGGTALLPVGSATAWDPLRPSSDASGYIQNMILKNMPHANFFSPSPAGTAIDGLNLAQFQWEQGRGGATGAGAQNGTNPMNSARKQINVKIDHNLNANHRFAVGWSYEHDDNTDNVSTWPGGFNGTSTRRPQVLTVNFTSTLSPTLVNEARFGITYGAQTLTPPWLSSDATVMAGAQAFLSQGGINPSNGTAYPVLISPGANVLNAGSYSFASNMINTASTYSGANSPLFNYADTLSWTHGHHAFKFGGELRLTRSDGFSGAIYPTVTGGAGGNNSPLGTAGLTGVTAGLQPLATTKTNSASLLYLLNGSVNSASTLYWIDSQDNVQNGTWEDITTESKRFRKQVANEGDFFVKDDWKVREHLTLNLGVRWEYYGSPYLRGGYTSSIADQGAGLFGADRSSTIFSNWMAPGNLYLTGYGASVPAASALSCQNNVTQSALLPVSTCDPNKLTTLIYVGPGSTLPAQTTIPNDYNNFGPAVGFAWQQGNTAIRGGMQVTFGGSGRNGTATENLLGNVTGNNSTGTLNPADFASITTGPSARALGLIDVPVMVPVKPTAPALPAGQIPIYNRNTTFTAYDPEFATPYVQNFTMSVTRSVSKNYTIDVRYVGTIGRKRSGTINLNQPNVYYNKELVDALTQTRAGLDAPLFDQMLAGLNLNTGVVAPNGLTYGPVGTVVGGVTQTGSAALRRNATFATNLAIGNFDAIASSLNTLTSTGVTGLEVSPITSNVGGTVLRNGCNRIADGKYDPNLPANATTNIPTRCFAENYIVANPQLSAATYTANLGKSNYHSMQAQVTARPIQGITFTTTYTLSKLLGLVNGGYTDPLNRDADYTYPYQNVTHDLRTNGTFELPLGPNKLVLGNSSGWLARAIEQWQTSVIFNTSSGNPRTVVAGHMFYATGNQNLDAGQNRADVVSPLFDTHMKGHAEWNGATGSYYGVNKYAQVTDPQCSATGPVNHTDTMGVNLVSNAGSGSGVCTLSAMALLNPDGTVGPIVLQNPLPGHRGTMPMSLQALGKWRFDANLGKSFRITESKSLSIRMDVTNVLNHPDLIDPDPQTGSSINTPGLVFGRIQSKGGAGANTQPRTFQLQARFSF
jgi:hypothetical protein